MVKQRKDPNVPHHNWCFTQFDEIEEILNCKWDYLMFGNEICPTTGRKHYQGYIEMKHARNKNGMKHIDKFAHWEPAEGNVEHNRIYCSKEGKITELGTPNQQGKRSDLEELKKDIIEGNYNTEIDIYKKCSNFQQCKYSEFMLKKFMKKRNWEMNITWIYGPSGSGKSKLAQSMAPNGYWKNGTKWWDGYNGTEDIILDDFRDTWWELTEMLKLLDRYPHIVEYKGGSISVLSKNIIITSIEHPNQCYKYHSEESKQLSRRIKNIIKK